MSRTIRWVAILAAGISSVLAVLLWMSLRGDHASPGEVQPAESAESAVDESPSTPEEPAAVSHPDAGSRQPAPDESPTGARIWGRVVCDGVGLPDVKVALFAAQQDWSSFQPLAEVQSEPGGRFEFSLPAGTADAFVVQANEAGFTNPTLEAKASESPLELEIGRLWSLQGIVRDAETGAAVTGAVLEIGRHRTVTDPRGFYRAEGIIPGDGELEVRHPDYVTQHLSSTTSAADVTLDIDLQRGQRLILEVVDCETGFLIAGARASLPGPRFLEASSGGEGRFKHHAATGDEVSVEVRADGYLTLNCYWEADGHPRAEPIRIPMVRPGQVVGSVVDEQGNPVVGARVHARYEADPRRWTLADEEIRQFGVPGFCRYEVVLSRTTDEQGRYQLAVFPSSLRFAVRASDDDLVSVDTPTLVVDSPSTIGLATIVLFKGAVVRGSIRKNGLAWQGRVRWTGRDGSPGGRVKTDPAGRYELRGVRPGEITVQLEDIDPLLDDHRVELAVAPGDVVEHDFYWTEARSTITGIVVSPSNDPVGEVLVRAVRIQPRGRAPVNASDKTDANGAFTIDVPAGAVFKLVAGRDASSVSQSGVAAGTEGVRLVLPQMGTLEVRLLEEDTREPLHLSGKATTLAISWRTAGEAVYQRYKPGVSIDKHGRTLLTVPVGTIDLLFSFLAEGYARHEVLGVPVADTHDELVVLLARGIRRAIELIEGSVPTREQAGHLLFFLAPDQLDQLAGPFPYSGDPANHRINDVNMWLAEPGLVDQLVHFTPAGTASIRSVTSGRYYLRSYPDDLVFEPAEIEIRGEDTAALRVLLRRRQ